MTRSGSFGENQALSPIDRLGTWWGRVAIRRRLGDLGGARVADLGCGYDAAWGRGLVGDGAEVTLVDSSVDPDLASLDGVQVLLGRLPGILDELDEETFDVVALNSVLEHLDDDEATLAQCRALLRPGGALFVNVPSWRGKTALEFSAFRLGLSPAEEMNDHRRYYDPRDLWPKLVAAGFRPQDITCRRHKLGLNTWAVARRPASPG